ncbi:MAG: lipoate--protein ligase family protein [Chlamydiota bacterium]
MGISGKPEALLEINRLQNEPIPVIKRFSGGGTVIVDENTLFITFIFNKDHLHIAAFPEPILRWSGDLYQSAWNLPNFQIQENDYCIGNKKCGGNAQYIKNKRWLHHTSFLWDYDETNMNYLQLPAKRPQYRQARSHTDFLCRLKEHAPSTDQLIEELKRALVKRFYIQEFEEESWKDAPHRQSTHFIEL